MALNGPCAPVKVLQNVCVGPKELTLNEAVSYCRRLGYKLATFRNEDILKKVATVLSEQVHLNKTLIAAKSTSLEPIKTPPMTPVVEKYLVGLTIDKKKAFWYNGNECENYNLLEIFGVDKKYLTENKDCLDAIVEVKYLDHSFGLEKDCGELPYKFLCSTLDVLETTKIATSSLASTTEHFQTTTEATLNSTSGTFEGQNSSFLSFFCNLSPTVSYSLSAAIWVGLIVLMVVLVKMLKKSPEKKQPIQAKTDVHEVNVYSSIPDIPKDKTLGKSSNGQLPSAPMYYDVTKENCYEVADEAYETISDVKFKK